MTMLYESGMLLVMTILILLVTGYLLYRLIRYPIKSFTLIFKLLGLLVLGAIVWAATIAFFIT